MTEGIEMTEKIILSNSGNYTVGRAGHKISRICFHRSAVLGDTAVGEGNYFQKHIVKASAGGFIDRSGEWVRTLPDSAHSWSTDEWDEDLITFSIEMCGLNGSPLAPAQIATAIQIIRNDPALKAVPNHRLTLAEIPPRKVGGYENHRDITNSYKQPGMSHVDFISELELAAIMKGVFA